MMLFNIVNFMSELKKCQGYRDAMELWNAHHAERATMKRENPGAYKALEAWARAERKKLAPEAC